MRRLYYVAVLCMLMTSMCSQAKDWAKYGRYEAANMQLKETPKVVFYGNSITDFWIDMDSTFFAENNYVDRGISGQTTSEMLVRFRQDVINLHPKVVVILAGLNDIAQNNGEIELRNVLGNIASMVELAKMNKIGVILCSVLPCAELSWRPEIKPAEKVRALNAMLQRYADANNVTMIDYYTPMSTPEGAIKPELSNDGCHPNLAGYKVMEPIVEKAIKKFVK